jgi:hypothetical protein
MSKKLPHLLDVHDPSTDDVRIALDGVATPSSGG